MSKAAAREIEVAFGPKYTVAIVYAPPGQNYICFEPMSAITNGINLAHEGKYAGLQTVAAGGAVEREFLGAAERLLNAQAGSAFRTPLPFAPADPGSTGAQSGRIDGNRNANTALASRQTTAPARIVTRAPIPSAANPATIAPKGPIPMYIIEYTLIARPRRWSGTIDWIRVFDAPT